MDGATCAHDDRWKARYAEIPRLVDSAVENTPRRLTRPRPAQRRHRRRSTTRSRCSNAGCCLKDHTPILAVLGAIAANYLPGDPVWLG